MGGQLLWSWSSRSIRSGVGLLYSLLAPRELSRCTIHGRILMKPLSTLRRLVHNINARLDQPKELIRSRVNLYPPACASVGRTPLSKSSVVVDSVRADIELIERVSHEWPANALTYRQTLDGLRSAARRLLPIVVALDAYRHELPASVVERLRGIEEQIICLARQPLFFPEMFHGVRLLADGSFSPLPDDENIHLRANGLLGTEDRIAVSKIYERILHNCSSPLRVAEIGSAVGRGSTRIGGQVVKRTGGNLYCIDPWKERSLYFGFLANMRICDLEATVVPIRSPSVDAAVLFDDGSLDAVFVDGSHIYPDVVADIDAYLPKIRKNGLMFGHDLHDVPCRFDRSELLSVSRKNNCEVNYTNSNGEVERVDVHPGVILAVQDRFGDDVEQFPGSVVWARQI